MADMRVSGGCRTGILGFLLLIAFTGAARAQDRPPSLRVPTIAFGSAAIADWATTYHALKNYQVREANPVLRPFDHLPARMVGLGAAIDVGMATGWNLSVGREHPRVAAAGLWAMTAFRAYLAIHNMNNVRRSARR